MKKDRFWPNLCQHKEDEFVGMIVVRHSPKSNTYGDVYVYDSGSGPEVCIRTGPWIGDYSSPGRLLDMATRSGGNILYREALRLIMDRDVISVRIPDTPQILDGRLREAIREVRAMERTEKDVKEEFGKVCLTGRTQCRRPNTIIQRTW